MLTFVVYDNSKDRTRSKIAKRRLDFGLYRVQKSVFLGDIESNRVEKIVLASKELMNEQTDQAVTRKRRGEMSWARQKCNLEKDFRLN